MTAAKPPHCASQRSGTLRASPLALGLGLCLALWAAPLGHADGLHCSVLDGYDFETAWLKFLAAEFPGQTRPPRASVIRKTSVLQAIHELIAILQFVDPYNYADDSPAWMATEENRAKARDLAAKYLVDFGRGAAPYVWQALELELRFTKDTQDPPDKFVLPYREAQQKFKNALDILEGERRQDAEYGRLQTELETLRNKANVLKAVEKDEAEILREEIAAKGDPVRMAGIKKRKELDAALKARHRGDYATARKELDELREKIRLHLETVDAGERVLEAKAKFESARLELEKWQQSTSNLGQGLDPGRIGGDHRMVTCGEYTSLLKQVLMQMGPEALPQVQAGGKSRRMLPIVKYLEEIWIRDRYVKDFAVASCASDKTQVTLAAAAFLKNKVPKETLVPTLIHELQSAPAQERPAICQVLKQATGASLADDPKAWKDWLEANRKAATQPPAKKQGEAGEEE